MCNGLGYILPIVIFSILYNAVKFFELETIYLDYEEWIELENGTNISTTIMYPWINATRLRTHPQYSQYVVAILNFIIMGEWFIVIEAGKI